jgi:hypothetical protein
MRSRRFMRSYTPMSEQDAPSLRNRLVQLSKDARSRAAATPPGREREALLNEARASDNALHIQEWLTSAGLRAPT